LRTGHRSARSSSSSACEPGELQACPCAGGGQPAALLSNGRSGTLDEGIGLTARDLSDQKLTGAIAGAATWTPERPGCK